MAKTLQHRRGTTTELGSVAGAEAEIFMDTTKNTLVVFDNQTPSVGHAMQPELISGTNIKTINGTSLLGSGDITISGGAGGGNTYNQSLNTTDSVVFDSALIGDVSIIGNVIGGVDAYGNPTSLSVDGDLLVPYHPATQPPLVTTIVNPDPDNSGTNDYFGQVSATSGNLLVVAAFFESSRLDYIDYAGKVYIFDINTGSLITTLDDPNFASMPDGDNFGTDVDINGTKVIVGAYTEDSDSPYRENSGKAYIYFDVSSSNSYMELTDPNLSNYGSFGWSTKISNSYALVTKVGSSGNAYLYDSSTGALIYTLSNPDGSYGYARGAALSDSYAVVYATNKFHVFDPVTGNLLYSVTTNVDYYQYTVTIHGDRLFVSDRATGRGTIKIYNALTGALIHTINNPSTNSNILFGGDVAASDKYILSQTFKINPYESGTSQMVIFDSVTFELLYTIDKSANYYQSININQDKIIGAEHNYRTGPTFGATFVYDIAGVVPGYGGSVTAGNITASGTLSSNTAVIDSALIGDVSIVGNVIAGVDSYGLPDKLIVDGDLHVTGNVTTSAPANVVTAGGVGSYAMLVYTNTSTNVEFGQSVVSTASSGPLYPGGLHASTGVPILDISISGGVDGTWMCMGVAYGPDDSQSSLGMWYRVS